MAIPQINFASLDRLKSNLQTNGLQSRDSSLYQVINQLIDFNRQFQTLNQEQINTIFPSGILPIEFGGTGKSSYTAGSIIFAKGSGSGQTLGEDNANLFWDDTNNRLGIGTNAPIPGLVTLKGGDAPANDALAILGTGNGIDFKNAANSVLYGVIISGSGPNRLRISTGGGTNLIVFQENGGITEFDGLVTFLGTTSSFPALKRSSAKLQVRLADDSAFTDLQADYLFANTASANRPVIIGGLPADKTNFGGLWFTSSAIGSSNYSFLGANDQSLFNTDAGHGGVGDLEFRVQNVTHFSISASGVTINGPSNTAPTVPLKVTNAANTQDLFFITNTGIIQLLGTTSSFPAFKRSSTTIQVRLADDSADGSISALNGTFSSLTSGRVTFAGTGGLLSDDADLTFSVDTLTTTKLVITNKLTSYNGVTSAGWGVPEIVASNRATAQTAANASVATFTPSADGSFEVSANVLVTASTTFTFNVECAYTDEGNTARVAILPFRLVGDTTALTSSVTNTNGAVPYNGVPIHIRCKSGTSITIRTQAAGTYTTVTYNIEGSIRQLA